MDVLRDNQLVKYGKHKKGVFVRTKKAVLIDKSLNKAMYSITQTLTFPYAKNLFLFDSNSQSLLVIEHLLLTGRGIFVFESFDFSKQGEVVDEIWSETNKSNDLTPNPIYLFKKKEIILKNILRKTNEAIDQLPFFFVPVSINKKVSTEHLKPKDLMNYIIEKQDAFPNILNSAELETLKKAIEYNHEQTYDKHCHNYSHDLIHSNYRHNLVISEPQVFNDVLSILNRFCYENDPDAIILSSIDIPTRIANLKPIPFLLISKKGFLVFNLLVGNCKYEANLSKMNWQKFSENGDDQIILNPIHQSDTQIQALLGSLRDYDLPITFRVVTGSAININLSHKALVPQETLEHFLDSWNKKTDDYFTPGQVMQFSELISKWND